MSFSNVSNMTATRSPHRAAAILCPLALLACLVISLSGCSEEKEPDKGANQSLVEIGERSLELAEDWEGRGKRVEAHTEYKRALWAFRYHQRLTGEEPFLLDEALDGVERTESRR